MYPKVFEQFKADVHHFGDVSKLPTRAYIEPLELGEEISVELERGKTIGISLEAIGMLNEKDATREVFLGSGCCVPFGPSWTRVTECAL